MTKLYIDLFLDENMNVLVAKILRARGLTVTTTDDAGRKGSSDSEQLKHAIEHGFAIASMDRIDFEALAKDYFNSGQEHFEIFIVADASAQIIARKLTNFLDFNTADEMLNQLVYL